MARSLYSNRRAAFLGSLAENMALLHKMPEDLEALGREAASTQAAGLVEKFLDLLVASGIGHRARIPCSKLVVARCNRGGYGVNFFDVQENTSDIAATKWYDKLFKGVVTDIEAAEFDEVIAFNMRQVAASNGILAEIEPHKATHQTLCGGHTTQGMKAVEARGPHWDTSLTMDGRLCLARVEEKSPTFAEAIRNGAEYTIVPSWVLKQIPGLDNAIQAAGNTGQNIAKAVNDPQMLQRVAIMVQAEQSFEQVKEEFKKTRPKNLEALPHMFNFIRKFPDTTLINGTITYIKSVDVKRKVSATTYDALQTDYKGANQAPRVRYGILAALYTDEKQDFVNGSVIKGLGGDKKITTTLEADAALVSFYDKIKKHPDLKDDTKAHLAWHALCADVAGYLCDKNTSAVAKHLLELKKPLDYALNIKHLQQICVQRIFTDSGILLTEEFSEYELTPSAVAKTLVVQKTIGARSSDDITSQMMSELGFALGDVVSVAKREKGVEPQLFNISKMENGTIHLSDAKDDKINESRDLAEFQQKKWRNVPKAADTGVLHSYEEKYCQHWSTANMMSMVKSSVVIAIHSAWNDETLVDGDVQMSLTPKAVYAMAKYNVGALVMSPNTQSVSIKEIRENEKTPMYVPTNGVFLGTTTIDDKVHAVVGGSVPPFVKKQDSKNMRNTLLIPYWMLEVTDKEDEANMKLSIDLSKHAIDANDPSIKVPVIKNSKALKAGDKLVVYVPAPANLNSKPALKRQKTRK